MLRYLLIPLPAILGVAFRWIVHAVGDPMIEREEIHPRHVYHFADFCLLIGVIISGLLFCGIVVGDFFDWLDRRHERKLLTRDRAGNPPVRPPD